METNVVHTFVTMNGEIQKYHGEFCSVQQDLDYLNFKYPIIRTVTVTVLLEYFVTGVCSIRVVQQSSIYKLMGFIYPNKFTYLNTFVLQLAHRRSDNGGPTVPICF